MRSTKLKMSLLGLMAVTTVAGFTSCNSQAGANESANVMNETPAIVLDAATSKWAPVALHDQDETVSAFVQAKNGNLIAGTSAGPYLSEDKGQTWQKVSLPEEMQAAVFSLTTDAAGLVYAGLSKYGVLVSADNGKTWELHNEGLNTGGPRSSYAILGTGPNILKGTFESGVYLSADKGKTWQPSNNGIPLDLNTSSMVSVSQLAQNESTVFALTDLGVRYSINHGKEWQKPTHNGIERLGYMLSIAAKGDTLFAGVGTSGQGVYFSTDNGNNWAKAGLETEEPYVLHVNAAGHLFAGTKDGEVYRSKNGGKSWEAFTNGLPANDGVYALFSTPEGKLLAGLNRKGIYLLQ